MASASNSSSITEPSMYPLIWLLPCKAMGLSNVLRLSGDYKFLTDKDSHRQAPSWLYPFFSVKFSLAFASFNWFITVIKHGTFKCYHTIRKIDLVENSMSYGREVVNVKQVDVHCVQWTFLNWNHLCFRTT
ncbi:hypothetical protein HAX54_027890 [Datura stramonium]|uniref:Uncharacterized protein n=1 Tax=Datura stramonium TaxID=4076 RepID=A0ABS8S935_DATST|nr:hypothetical protein [Datura stramonium]